MSRAEGIDLSQVEQIGTLRGLLSCLVEAVREPETNPARGAYLNHLLARADDALATGLIAGMDEGCA